MSVPPLPSPTVNGSDRCAAVSGSSRRTLRLVVKHTCLTLILERDPRHASEGIILIGEPMNVGAGLAVRKRSMDESRSNIESRFRNVDPTSVGHLFTADYVSSAIQAERDAIHQDVRRVACLLNLCEAALLARVLSA